MRGVIKIPCIYDSFSSLHDSFLWKRSELIPLATSTVRLTELVARLTLKIELVDLQRAQSKTVRLHTTLIESIARRRRSLHLLLVLLTLNGSHSQLPPTAG